MDGCNHIGHGYNRQYWPYGLLELACLVVYAVEVAAHLRVFGVSYYFDKRWMLVFLFVSSCCTLEPSADARRWKPGRAVSAALRGGGRR